MTGTPVVAEPEVTDVNTSLLKMLEAEEAPIEAKAEEPQAEAEPEAEGEAKADVASEETQAPEVKT